MGIAVSTQAKEAQLWKKEKSYILKGFFLNLITELMQPTTDDLAIRYYCIFWGFCDIYIISNCNRRNRNLEAKSPEQCHLQGGREEKEKKGASFSYELCVTVPKV